MRQPIRDRFQRTGRISVVTACLSVAAGTATALSTVGDGADVGATAQRTMHQVEVSVDAFVPPRRSYLISDSVLAAITLGGNADLLVGTTWMPDLEICRRLVDRSCQLSSSPRPPTVVDELRALNSEPDEFDLLVIATGYNDHSSRLPADLATVVELARAVGFHHIVWLTYHADGSGSLFADFAAMNDVLDTAIASGAYPDLTLWDFDAFTSGNRAWFGSDNIHLTSTGARAVADWLSRQAGAYDVG